MRPIKAGLYRLVFAAALFAVNCEQTVPDLGGGAPDAEEIEEEEEEAPPVITGITLLSLPDTTVYGRNAVFNPAGLVVAWTWSNADTTEIAAGKYTLTEPDMAKYSPQIITVSAGEYSTTFAINVMDSDKILESITVSYPAKVSSLGSEFDKTGLVITGHYSNSTTGNVTSYATITGYDKRKRGAQELSARVNGKTAPIPGVSVRVPADMAVTLALNSNSQASSAGYRRVYFKGENIDMRYANFHAQAVTANGNVTISYDAGNLLDTDYVTGFDPNAVGKQNATLHLDDKEVYFLVSVIDVAPEVWFDYGYRRDTDTEGVTTSPNPGAGVYYALPKETLVLAPVRFLVGYDRNHKDLGASYSWSVSGGSFSSPASATGEFYSFTPTNYGTSTVTVSVTGNNYITGQPITTTATTQVVCHNGTVSGGTAWTLGTVAGGSQRMLHHAPGQYATGGSGHGWSLGSFGGYEVWRVSHQSTYYIRGNPFAGWSEPGVIWVQEDGNGNGIPDEMWYELKGAVDSSADTSGRLARRHAVTYMNDGETGTQADQAGFEAMGKYADPRKYWADSRGRAGLWGSFWYSKWPHRITFTGTLLGNPNSIMPTNAINASGGYVDSEYGANGAANDYNFPINRAIRADGSPITLKNVSFIKVHTGELCRSSVFGDKSTEIYSADYLGVQTDFPLPEDS